MKFAWFPLIICISIPISADIGTLASGHHEEQPLSYQFNESRILNSSEVIEVRILNSSEANDSRVLNSSEVIEGSGRKYWPYFVQPIGIGYGVMYGAALAGTYKLFEYTSFWEIECSDKFLANIAFFSDVLVAPLVEEAIFRVPLYILLKSVVLPKITNNDAEDLVTSASVISGIIFASFHYGQYKKGALIMVVCRSFTSSFHGILLEAQGFTSTLAAHITNNFIGWLIFRLQRKHPPLPM